MHRANASAGEHGDRQFRNHGHVDRDAICGLYSQREQHVGEFADALVQFGVRQLQRGAIFGFPEKRGLVSVLFEVAIETVVRDVQLAADEPLRVRQVPLESFHRRLEPIEVLGLFAPESLGIFRGLGAHLFVFIHRAHARLLREIRGRRDGFFVEDVRIELLHRCLLCGEGSRTFTRL